MNTSEDVIANMDTEFDQHLVDIKPYVIRLPHKSDRQKCALWIKKFCEPPSGISGRKNRNMYSQLLLHMLKRGQLDGPFTQKPEPGSLPTLPSYMAIKYTVERFCKRSMYYDDVQLGDEKENCVPDWVAGELASELTGISSIGPDIMAPTTRSFEEVKDRFNDAIGRSPRNEHRYTDSLFGIRAHRSQSPPLITPEERVPPLHLDDFGTHYTKGKSLFTDDDSITNGELDFEFTKPKTRITQRMDSDDWRNPTFGSSVLKDSTFRNDTTKLSERDMDMKSKMLEARFQEEKLRLQQKHDSNVQKILERKNTELEDLKTHYRNKSKEQDDTMHKMEKKLQHYQKELSQTKDTKDRQLEEIQRVSEETSQNKQAELEKKLHDSMARFEQEKFDLQKQHTKNIQELLDDTNNRLQKMEEEYTQQMQSTSSVIKELESRVQQLSQDAETLGKIRNQLEQDKALLTERCDRLQGDLIDYQARNAAAEKELSQIRDEHEREIRSLRNKHDASVDFIKQEHQIHTAKTSDTICDLEGHVTQLRQNIDKTEQDHTRQIRELEEQHYQDKVHLEHLHDKKLKNLQQELEQLDESSQKKLRKLEESVRHKEDELRRLKLMQEQKSSQSEQALENFKSEVERSSHKIYEDMKKQMEKVETDLNRSKLLREKQTKEFQKQLQEEKYRHEQQITEMQLAFEQEKSRLMQEVHTEKDSWKREKELESDGLRESLHKDMTEIEARARERQDRDAKTISELDNLVQKLREEVVQANQLRKQQLVELGLLREEEKQKMVREHEQEVSRFQFTLDQQRLEMEKNHGAEMEATLEKTNSRLKEIESEYGHRLQKSNEMATDLQGTIERLKGDIERVQQEANAEISQNSQKYEEERRKWKQQHSSALIAHQQETESVKNKLRRMERRLIEQEQDYEEKITQLRSQYEQKMRGMVSAGVRQELEETIASLKSQITSLQQRCALIQDQLDYPTMKYPVNQFNLSHTGSNTPSIRNYQLDYPTMKYPVNQFNLSQTGSTTPSIRSLLYVKLSIRKEEEHFWSAEHYGYVIPKSVNANILPLRRAAVLGAPR